MVSCWLSLVLAASLATSVGAEAAVGSTVAALEAEAALSADDVCGTVEGPRRQQQCALSALQRRGQRLEVHAADGEASDSMDSAAALTGAGPTPDGAAPVVPSAKVAPSADLPQGYHEMPRKEPVLMADKGHGGDGGRGGYYPGGWGYHPGSGGYDPGSGGYGPGGGGHHPGSGGHHPGAGGYHPGVPSCQTYGCEQYDYIPTNLCQCYSSCYLDANCCSDYVQWCTGKSGSLHK